MRRFALLLAAGTLWLFLAAIPAFADGGPHVASVNSGSTSLTADGCAGCHRAHTASGEGLLVEATEEALCLSCHGATGTGSAVDVITGVQYVGDTIDGPVPPGKSDDPILGYLRNGGFDQAHMGGSDGQMMRIGYFRSAVDVSFRMKVPVEATADDVTSAHLDLDGAGGVTDSGKIWGHGLSGGTNPVVDMKCSSCHNVHGNGQFRVLNTLNRTEGVATSTTFDIESVKAGTNRFFTTEAHSLIVGDIVTISGVTGAAPSFGTAAQYIVKTVAGNTFTVAATTNPPTTAQLSNPVIDVTTDGTGGTVQRWASIVDDAPLPAGTDTRNYTVIQTRGTQGANATYMLYESNVLAARTAGTFNGIPGDYSTTAGDYFRRTVPWNPAINGGAGNTCNTAFPTTGTCTTANDAPNGRPATTANQVAFNDQLSAWCSTCHTRYYANGNTNPGIFDGNPAEREPSFTADVARTITGAAGTIITVAGTDANGAAITSAFSVGDIVTFGAGTTEYHVVVASALTFAVSTVAEGAAVAAPASSGSVIRKFPFSASSWYFPRNGSIDAYKYQHSTASNRVCSTCHVGHGSDAQMTTGLTTFSRDLGYPDLTAGDPAYNSRLLKIDNRGTCQGCHDPTLTTTAGQQVGNPAAPTVP